MNVIALQLQQLGFDGWVIDYVEGPAVVLHYLCAVSNIHRIVRDPHLTPYPPLTDVVLPRQPLALDARKVDTRAVESSGIRKYVAGDTSFSILTSQYGRKEVTTQANRLKKAQNLVEAGKRSNR